MWYVITKSFYLYGPFKSELGARRWADAHLYGFDYIIRKPLSTK